MTLVSFVATAMPFVAAIGVAIFVLWNLRELTPSDEAPEVPVSSGCKLTVDQLGEIEGTIPNLIRVLVVANTIEKPEGRLGKAVEENFRRGVKYLFLISASTAPHEKERYFRLLRAYEQMHTREGELLDIKALPFDWDDFPIIFYQTCDSQGNLASIAFRGSEVREGLGTYYDRVPTEYAHTIATALLADAPKEIEALQIPTRSEFEDSQHLAKIIDIVARRA